MNPSEDRIFVIDRRYFFRASDRFGQVAAAVADILGPMNSCSESVLRVRAGLGKPTQADLGARSGPPALKARVSARIAVRKALRARAKAERKAHAGS